MNDVSDKFYQWLNRNDGYENINIFLLKKLINSSTKGYIKNKEIDDIYPFLLVELKNDVFFNDFIKILKKELASINNYENCQMMYLKMNLKQINIAQLKKISDTTRNLFDSYEILHVNMTINLAYGILIYISSTKNIENDQYEKILAALMILTAKEAKIREFSVLCESYCCLKKIDDTFLKATLLFIEEQQNIQGGFYLPDPFDTSKKIDVSDEIIVNFHLYNAWRKLHNRFIKTKN